MFSVGTFEWFLLQMKKTPRQQRNQGDKNGNKFNSLTFLECYSISSHNFYLVFLTCFWSQPVTINGLLPLINKETYRFTTLQTIIDGQPSTTCITVFNKNCLWVFKRQSLTSRCFLQVFIKTFNKLLVW